MAFKVLYKEEIAEFKHDFDEIDTDKDGFISGDEVRAMLKLQLERDPTEDEVTAMLTEFDIDKDGKITWDEYMTTICGEGWTEDDPPPRPKPATLMVAVDGGIVAKQAFHYAARLMRKDDKLIVYHVTNPGRYKDMAPSFQPDVIKSSFETEAIKADIAMTHTVEYVVEEKKDESDKVRNKIRDYASSNADVVVLGSFGHKSHSKVDDEHKDSFSKIGSTTSTVTSGCDAAVVVLKRSTCDLKVKGCNRYCVAVDGSELAHAAFVEGCTFMKRRLHAGGVHRNPGREARSAHRRQVPDLYGRTEDQGRCKGI